MAQHDWGVNLRYFDLTLFSRSVDVSLKAYGSFSISISSPERAILEVLDGDHVSPASRVRAY
jgi:hypothetical protein